MHPAHPGLAEGLREARWCGGRGMKLPRSSAAGGHAPQPPLPLPRAPQPLELGVPV